MRKLLPCVTLLLLTCANVPAQTESGTPPFPFGEAEAARLLKSQGNRERAWGAYLAGAYGLKEHTPLLVALLEDPALAAGGWEESIARQAALDALIRLDAEVPAEVLRAFPQHFADEALILLARSPEKNSEALLEMFAGLENDGYGYSGARWLAAGNLLAAVKARGFAARLLGGLKVEAYVTVLDADGSHGLGDGTGGGCGGGSDFGAYGDFPPVGYYRLTHKASRGAVVVAPGKRPVFYVRSLHMGGVGCYPLLSQTDIVRIEYLAALLDTTEDALGLDARPSFTVICKDTKECRRELAGVRGQIEQSYAAVLGRLLEKNLLDGVADAPASPPMTFNLYDERSRRTFPLPDKLKGVTVVIP